MEWTDEKVHTHSDHRGQRTQVPSSFLCRGRDTFSHHHPPQGRLTLQLVWTHGDQAESTGFKPQGVCVPLRAMTWNGGAELGCQFWELFRQTSLCRPARTSLAVHTIMPHSTSHYNQLGSHAQQHPAARIMLLPSQAAKSSLSSCLKGVSSSHDQSQFPDCYITHDIS